MRKMAAERTLLSSPSPGRPRGLGPQELRQDTKASVGGHYEGQKVRREPAKTSSTSSSTTATRSRSTPTRDLHSGRSAEQKK
ncbi:Putative LOC100197594 [Caligus rogercresseyi]|uniref:LOC100197594 n=1 Tax=Caligus rogercresseyi TaxID=217165 RepID=A0A7T8JX34_CALRO|nr:Putative LOC100197594 [Caligus rogercresseyi]